MEAIILAGGLGTRLRGVVPQYPKCMAPINGKPFIDYLVSYLTHSGVNRFVFSLGFMSDKMISHIQDNYCHLDTDYVVESEPLGTGGAIRFALEKSKSNHPIVLNGDSLFEISPTDLMRFHLSNDALITCALKPMREFERYGTVMLDPQGVITQFEEKKYCLEGNINGGVYIIDKQRWINEYEYPKKFSFEKDVLELLTQDKLVYGQIQEGYFIDIGIPEDYDKAQIDFLDKMHNIF